ncbi:hypothetical protein G7Z17_g7358 [Cylindrodendrum hubeiense]|uniref:Kinesin n=1 Tax=Cylindrodendrum hubeiense TaxID=595255 RepID=A0A9P5H3V5_9HYPO|nr:hypothetical protein G7Z17_g7358 [Cylindrodendrum hubeiense]
MATSFHETISSTESVNYAPSLQHVLPWKSQLAIEYAYRLKDQDTLEEHQMWVFWVHAGSITRIEEGFKAIADAMKIPGRTKPDANIMQLVYDHLSKESIGRWSMILDSADDYHVLFGVNENSQDAKRTYEYLPQSPNGSIILTTRDRRMARELIGYNPDRKIIEVGPMSEKDALKLLANRLGPPSDAMVAADLVNALELIPLAISQAAAYIQARTPRTSLENYLASFKESKGKRLRLLSHNVVDLRRDGGGSNAILTTWQLSFDHIHSKRPSAADLLSLMSFFNRQGIPEWLLKSSRNTVDDTQGNLDSETDSETDSESEISNGEIDDIFNEDVAMLSDYCLITAIEGDVFEMHGLVQLSTRKWLEANNLQEVFKEQFIVLMAEWFPRGDYENWEICQTLFAHTEVAVEHRPQGDSAKKAWAQLLNNGGENKGRLKDAEELETRVLETHKMKPELNHLDKLTSMANLATIFGLQDRWAEAEKLDVQVLETRRRELGEDHRDTLASKSNLAVTYSKQGRLKEAERMEMEVMEALTTKLGAEHTDTIASVANFATLMWEQGRWDESEKLEVQVIEAHKKNFGEDHPDTLSVMSHLASTYKSQRRWEEAEKMFLKVMETRKIQLGADHPDTLASMVNLASMLSKQGRSDEAEVLQVQAMEAHKRKFGEDHPDTLTSMSHLASTYERQSRWKEAETLLVKVMEIRKIKMGAYHPDTLADMAGLASKYNSRGRLEEAATLEAQVMETRMVTLGLDHPDTLTSMVNLANTWNGQGRHEDALVLLEQAARGRQHILGSEHHDTISSLSIVEEWRKGLNFF